MFGSEFGKEDFSSQQITENKWIEYFKPVCMSTHGLRYLSLIYVRSYSADSDPLL